MTSGPVYVAALERDNAVAELRKLMGATDPAKADAGTIRKEFGESIEQNAIHGSDSDENANDRDRVLLRGIRTGVAQSSARAPDPPRHSASEMNLRGDEGYLVSRLAMRWSGAFSPRGTTAEVPEA